MVAVSAFADDISEVGCTPPYSISFNNTPTNSLVKYH